MLNFLPPPNGGLGTLDLDSIPLTDSGFMAVTRAFYAYYHRLPEEPDYFGVAVFGSARSLPGDWEYDAAKDLAFSLAELDFDIVTGGGPGVMEAANAGAMDAKSQGRRSGRSYGICTTLFKEERPNCFLEKEYAHQHFATRLLHFTRRGRAFVAMPGGIGTLLEVAWVLQLIQANLLNSGPLILYGEMWFDLINWMKSTMVPGRFIGHSDLSRVRILTKKQDVLELISALRAAG